uniref:C2H2-type domain-containing protein n=1 Tax=Pseudonaja textilis TaxID=8673 RepID=A0A670YR21_PSETE
MDASSNSSSSSSSSHSSAAVPPADGQDDRAVVRPAQGSPALPPTKEPPLWDPSPSPSPRPDDIMRPCASAQAAALSLAKFPATVPSTPQLQTDPSQSLPNPSPFPLGLPLAEDGVQLEDHRDEDGGREAQLFFAADGSAYLLASGHVLLPKGSPVSSTPQVSILHIQDSGGPNQGFMSVDQMSQNTSAPGEVTPQGAFYSYRLAGAPAQNTPAKNATRGRDKVMPGGPVWLCLTCRLSFNQGRTLVSHARTEHGVQLCNEKCQALDGGASAVFQGTDLGFLEPNNPTTEADLNARMCSRWVNPIAPNNLGPHFTDLGRMEGCQPQASQV